MIGFTSLKLRWRALLRRREFNGDVDDKVAFHLAMRAARAPAAHRRFGNPTRVREDLRELRGWGWLERLVQDLRYALRQVRRNPGFAFGAILPLALAIGCIASVLTLADAVLFRPTGVRDPGRLAAVYTFSKTQNRYLSDSYPDFRDIAALSGLVQSAAAYLRTSLSVRTMAGTERMNAELVTGGYFEAAGIAPALGRPLTADDDLPGAAPVALASYALWETHYGRSPAILGAVIWLNRVPVTIVGVMPRGYQGMLLDWYPDCSLWTSLSHFNLLYPGNAAPGFQNRRDIQMLMLLARLRPGASVTQLQAALDVLAPRVAARPEYRFIALPSLEARFFPAYRAGTLRFLWMLLAVSAAAIAIACFNLAGLLLARAAGRRKEIATRLAIGASRLRVLQQFIVENGLLAIGACALSLPVALGLASWLRDAPVVEGLSLSLDLSPDWRALAVGMLGGLVTAFVAGVVPAWRASRGEIALRNPAKRAASWDLFLAAQIACAMTILVPAGAMTADLRNVGQTRLGYDSQGVLLGSASVDNAGQLDRDGHALLTRLRSEAPQAALASTSLPTVMRSFVDVSADGMSGAGGASWKPVSFNWVSDGYLELLHIPIRRGRTILAFDDRHAPPSVVVNQSAAALLWPGQNPVGRHLRLRSEAVEREVIGVVDDIRLRPLGKTPPPEPYLFLPLFQKTGPSGLEIHVRTPGAPLLFAGTLREALLRIDPDTPLFDLRTLESQVEAGLKPMQLAAQATAAVSFLGIALAMAGMFAASAFRIAQHKKEIAIRIAIGAPPGRVIRSFASRGLWIGLAGACLGLLPALWGSRLLQASIAGAVVPGGWLFLAAGPVLAIASGLAAFAAARRIAGMQPSDVLRVQ